MSLLDPLTHALAAVLAAAHTGLTGLGADPASGLTWLLSIAVVVVVVRTMLLPLTAYGVRHTRAAGRARPHLQQLADRYRGRTDADSLRRLSAERRRIAAEHGMPRLGFLPLLVQLPIWIALCRLVSEVAGGQTVGAMSVALVASLGGAAVFGVRLAERGYIGSGAAHLAVVAGFALGTAALSYVSQRHFVWPNTVVDAMPSAVLHAQQVLPVVSAVSLLAVAGVVPVGLLAYWVCNATWTLAQSAVVARWFPTPGTPASMRRASR